MYHLYVRLKIENGLRDAANGNVVTDAMSVACSARPMVVNWTAAATDDLLAIYHHIARDSIQYAVMVTDQILDRTKQIGTFPESGATVPEFQRSDIREVFLYSYRIIYLITGQRHPNPHRLPWG